MVKFPLYFWQNIKANTIKNAMNPITLPMNKIPDQSPSEAAIIDIMINDVINTSMCICKPSFFRWSHDW